MSDSTGDCGCCDVNPCSHVPTQEGISSEIQNLITTLLGPVTVVLDSTGRGTWTVPCSPTGTALPCIPPNTGEGFICYIIRILQSISLVPNPPSALVWTNTVAYCKNTIVASGTNLYFSLQAVPIGTDISNAAYWMLFLTAPAGIAGPQGPPGTPGAPGSPTDANRTVVGNTALADNDEVLYCNSAGAMAVTIPLMGTLTANHRFTIINQNTGVVTITPTGPDVIGLPGSAGAATYAIGIGETVSIKSKSTAFWFVV